MARSLWSGSLSFGLVNVRVALYSAVKDTDVHFHQLHDKDHVPIEVHRVCADEDTEVPQEEIAHGYEDDDGELVVLSDAELATAAPRKTRTIDIEAFVDLADVDPIHFDHPHVLMPAGDAEGTARAYRLLLEVMRRTERAALGRFVLRTREYLVLVRVRDERLALTTLLFADEVRPTKGLPTPGKKDKPTKKQLDQTVALIEALSCDWDPERYEKRLERIIREKRKGETIKAPEPERRPTPVPDLMAALEKTFAEIEGGDRRTPAAAGR